MKVNKTKECELNIVRLKELLSYNKHTGKFIWLVRRNSNAEVGSVAGTLNNHGYVSIGIEGCRHLAHRLAWFYHYGMFPDNLIDHINGVKDDNRIENLREVSYEVNQQNRPKYKRLEDSLPTGVSVRYKGDGSLRDVRAQWVGTDGKLKVKYFNAGNYISKDELIKCAANYRQSKVLELNTLGAKYTLRHGKQIKN